MKANVRAAVYARYSSHSQTEQSIEGQIRAAEELCEKKGYELVAEYCDRAKTGRNDNREAFQQMLKESARKQWSVLIVWKVDRIGRNREEIAINKHRLRKNGVTVEYAAENLPDTPEGVILESVLEGMAEYYSLQLSQNIKRGIRESALKGKRHGGVPPFGYRQAEDKTMVIEESEAPAVRYAYEHFAAGETVAEITRVLNEKGYRTRTGREFGRSSLRTILRSPLYKGTFSSLGGEVVIEDGVPAIVDRELWDRVQDIIDRGNARRGSNRWTNADYILTGRLFCGECGDAMTGLSGTSRTGQKHMYYVCHGKRNRSGCTKSNAPCQYLEEVVLSETLTILQDEALMDEMVKAVFAYYESTEDQTDERDALRAQLAGVDASRLNLLRALEKGADYDLIAPRMEELKGQAEDLRREIARLDALAAERLTEDHIRFFLERFRDMDHSDRKVQKLLIHTFISAIYVYDDGGLKIVYNFHEHTVLCNPSVRLDAHALHCTDTRRTMHVIMHEGRPYVVLCIKLQNLTKSEKKVQHLYVYKGVRRKKKILMR